MSKTSKFPGQGRLGDTASGGSRVNGNNNALYNERADSGSRGPGAPKVQYAKAQSPGSNMGAGAISSHNDIGAFTRGVKSRGPYGGPSFRSLSRMIPNYQSSTPSSAVQLPSGGMAGNGPSRANPQNRGSISRGHGTGSGNMGGGTARRG